MQITKVRLKPSSIDGIGLFAICDIKEGDIVFSHITRETMEYLTERQVEEIEDLELKKMIKDFSVFKKGMYFVPDLEKMDIGMYVNHSIKNNVVIIDNTWVAVRDIRKGEEILQNYDLLGCEQNEKWRIYIGNIK